jgi:hypothetical protein
MNALQITLFLIANVIFLSQAGRNIHHLVFASQPSVLDKYDEEQEKARSQAQLQVLLAEYQEVLERIRALEKGATHTEVMDLRQQNSDLYDKQSALRSEISEREEKARDIRDLWIFSGYGAFLIVSGAVLYRQIVVWPGFAILVTGFCILEYWASPSLFGNGAVAEYHQLLLSKTVITFLALAALYLFWANRASPYQTHQMSASAQHA